MKGGRLYTIHMYICIYIYIYIYICNSVRERERGLTAPRPSMTRQR